MTPGENVARRVDHINIRVADPRPLFTLLTERLQLPVMWPPAALPGFEIAGVGVGNVHIEPTRFGARARRDPNAAARLFTVCLEPGPTKAAVTELTRRGIAHSQPIPYVGDFPRDAETEIFHRAEGERGRLWTWILLGGFFGDRVLARRYSSRAFQSHRLARLLGQASGNRWAGTALNSAMAPRRPYPFFCEWSAFDIGASRERAREELQRRGGGPIGVRRVREIVLGAKDLSAETDRWRMLLEPAPMKDGAWELGDGPAIRVVPDREDQIQALVWEVASLDHARRFLEKEAMLGVATDAQLTIRPSAMHGLEIRLVEPVNGR